MFAGLDFGTSNSALGIYIENQVKLLSLYQDEKYLPSTLYTFDRSLICDYIYQNLSLQQKEPFKQSHLKQLQSAQSFKRYEGFNNTDICNFFGKQAIENYIENPEEGVFIKSPKSFLGSIGLTSTQINFFEDLVCSMLLNIKTIAEKQTQQSISKVVIGRPVNFQGVNSEKSNQQAIEIITKAAKVCGYKEIEFLYEPLAAGVDFETSLKKDQIVLVVDIGGGTTDCSMVKMGPSHVKKDDRKQDFLAHTGQRIGGNDLDILLAYHTLMPLFGRGSQLKRKDISMPDAIFWYAVSINNVGDQAKFSSPPFARELKAKLMDAKQPELFKRLIYLQSSKQNHRLVRSAELAKIALSNSATKKINLDYIETELSKDIDQSSFELAVKRPLEAIKKSIQEAINLAQTTPDLVYITGGTAKSPTVRKAIEEIIPNVTILDGDYYGSVAAGLTKWAKKIWS
ncbi:MAG: putative chaperone protein [Polaribacter sp.]|jgi:hypothetical chaperone protein